MMQSVALSKKRLSPFLLTIALLLFSPVCFARSFTRNNSGYFEKRGVNVFVFSPPYNGVFFDEKTPCTELIYHGMRTATAGAVRRQNSPGQRNLIPILVDRKADRAADTIPDCYTAAVLKGVGDTLWGEDKITVGGCADYIFPGCQIITL